MTARLGLLAVLAVVLQQGVVARLPVPGSPPDLVLVLVVAVGLRAGPAPAVLLGFGAGLLADLSGDTALGRLALAYVVAGLLAGLLEDADGGAWPVAALVGGAAAAVAVVAFAAHGVLLDDPRSTLGALGRSLASVVPYSAALTPAVVPPVAAVLRRAGRRL